MDISYLKRNVSVPHVLSKFGHEPVFDEGTALVYPVPWRPDSEPSLAVFKQNGGPVADRWADRARQDSGDVLDLYRRIMGCDVSTAIADLGMLVDEDFDEPEVEEQRQLDLEGLINRYNEIFADADMLRDWLDSKEMRDISTGWLATNFGVVMDGQLGVIHIPYRNREGAMVYARTRLPGQPVHSPPGKNPGNLYGEHLDTQLSRPVVLCEGESDVWSGTYATQDYVFLGVPGASIRPENTTADQLAGRTVILAMDGDTAGWSAAEQWADFLSIKVPDTTVRIANVPAGKDLREVDDIPGLLASSRLYHTARSGIVVAAKQYRKVGANGDVGAPLSDWVCDVTTVFVDNNGAESYEVQVNGNRHLLLWTDLLTKKSLTNWCNEKGLAWLGSDQDVQKLGIWLRGASNFAPIEHGFDCAGLHEGHYVWPGDSHGERPVRYLKAREGVREADFRLSSPLSREDVRATIDVLLTLNEPKVIDPILAWLFASFLRSTVTQFPVLNISGAAGTGKTATLELVVPLVTGHHRLLGLGTQPTRYALSSVIGDSNSFPICLDEYRPSGRYQEETLRMVDDVVRACYNREARETGGAVTNVMHKVVYEMQAPLIVAGEALFSAESLRDRAVMVHMTGGGRNRDAMDTLKALGGKTIARSVMSHVLNDPAIDHLVEERMYENVLRRERMQYNMGYLHQGWTILEHVRGLETNVRPPDFSAVLENYQEAQETDEIGEALLAVYQLDRSQYGESVWIDEDLMYVNVSSFVAEARRLGASLPGDSQTVGKYMIEQYGAKKQRLQRMGTRVMVSVFPADRVIDS